MEPADVGTELENEDRNKSIMKKSTGFALGALVGLSLAAGATSGLQDTPKAPAVWLTNDLLGRKVVSSEGDNMGEIKDLVVHPGNDTGYAVLSFGSWLGFGGKLFAMPWSVLRTVDRVPNKPDSKRSLVLPIEKERLKQAPGFDEDHWPEVADANWTKKVDAFYGDSPKSEKGKAIEASARTARIAWKASDLRGYTVESPTGDELGRIEELAVDINGRVSYVALGLEAWGEMDERTIAVPWDSFEFSLGLEEGDEQRLTLKSTRTKLDRAPKFLTGKKHIAEMCEPAWVARVHEYFGVAPYWVRTVPPAGAVGTGK